MKTKRKTRTFRLRMVALFHASQSSSWCGVASVIRSGPRWKVVKLFAPDASAIFVGDFLVYSENPEDRPINYFGYICETPEDVRIELEAIGHETECL